MSMDRKGLVVGNWKMELSHKGEVEMVRALKELFKGVSLESTNVVVCPSFPSLPAVAEGLKKSQKIGVGAQTVHWDERGPVTGGVAISQISPFVKWCLVGHSDQRALTSETEEQVAARAGMLVRHGITPVVCIGETYEERAMDQSVEKVTNQMKVLISALTRAAMSKIVVVYEPIWAISGNDPGELPEPDEVAGMAVLIRKNVAVRYGSDVAERLRVIYGGSVNERNVDQFVQEPGIDGVLPGAASLQPRQFIEIAKQVEAAT